MAMVCDACGLYVTPVIEPDRQSARCSECGHVSPMKLLPLFIVTGTSGAGKSTVVPELRRRLPDFDVFDMDLLAGDDWQQIKWNWLKIAYSIAQSGRGTVLCGTVVPENLAGAPYLPFFDGIYYLNLHCDDATRAARLRARPAYRGTTEAFIADHANFARWLLTNAATAFDPPMPTVDSTGRPPGEVAAEVASWVLTHWTKRPSPSID
ncbi:MAG TPA: hypothetical protein VK464_27000 [Symbiobacteriaceae bacterium]|nr:hypothetical protein [Symbiobacteriaceae bacterium]